MNFEITTRTVYNFYFENIYSRIISYKTWIDKPVIVWIFFHLLYKNKQTEVENWHQISGEPVSICKTVLASTKAL